MTIEQELIADLRELMQELGPVDETYLERLRTTISRQTERADYAWRNTNSIEKARQDAEAKLSELRHHLTQLATFADQAVGVLATIEAENSDEEEKLQAIIDGLQKWAPDAMRDAVLKA